MKLLGNILWLILGVWIHGHAGDILAKECTAEGYNSRDLIDRLHLGFKKLYNNSV